MLTKNESLIQDFGSEAQLVAIAQEHGTPAYVYSKQKIINNFKAYEAAFAKHRVQSLICYAVKANSNLAILSILASLNSGFDIVSLGEMKRVLQAGGNAKQIVFSGVGKQDFEIKQALLAGIYCFNVESQPELYLINQIAEELNTQASVSIRVNPNINANSHPYISTGLKEHKFGIAIEDAEKIYILAKELEYLNIIGIDCHIGSQLIDVNPLKETCKAINQLVATLAQNNIQISHLNLGGGLGIDYDHVKPSPIPSPETWVETILNNLDLDNKNIKILIEPGRSIVGNAGVLLTKVIYNKEHSQHQHNFTIVDAAMNDLLRPALYSARHKIINLNQSAEKQPAKKQQEYLTTVVGPVCESSDVFAKNINLPSASGDTLAILDAGAYGFVMSSNYNSRPRAAEILIDNNSSKIIRPRETIEDLYNNEIIL